MICFVYVQLNPGAQRQSSREELPATETVLTGQSLIAVEFGQ